jgi:succinylarginine dihydrolase
VAYAGSFVWTANAATATVGDDGQVRLLTANLAALPHRQMEAPGRQAQLRTLLPGTEVLESQPTPPERGDEGAANHSRVVGPLGTCDVFVWGRRAGEARSGHPARQTREASAAAARRLGVADPLLIQQHPAAIDAGAFHNDVVMVGEGNRLLLHPQAWVDQEAVLGELQRRCGTLHVHEVPDLSLAGAVSSYLFNSQLLPTHDQGWVLVAPGQCAEGPARRAVERLLDEGFINRVQFVDLDQSMRGGGGPACLRLRVPLEVDDLAPGALLTDEALQAVTHWVETHYRDRLTWDDLTDPALPEEVAAAMAAWPLAGNRPTPND